MLIYLMGKDVDVTNITSEGIKNSSLSLAVFDGNKRMNSVFLQTESLTNNMIGITEYGRMTFNSENTNLNAMITVTADVEGHGLVSKTLSVQSCLDTVEGTELGTGGGGGGADYTAGYGIKISENNEISIDENEVASKSDLVKVYSLGSGHVTESGYRKKYSLYNDTEEIVGEVTELNINSSNTWGSPFTASGNIYKSVKRLPFPESFSEFNLDYTETYKNISVEISVMDSAPTEAVWGCGRLDYDNDSIELIVFSPVSMNSYDIYVTYSLNVIGYKLS